MEAFTPQLVLALEGGSLGEAIIVFLGLLAYVVPGLIKRWQEREGASQQSDEGRPGRRPGRRGARGGGAFTDPAHDPRERRKQALKRWQDLLVGEDEPQPAPRPKKPVAKTPAPRPTAIELEPPSPTLVELGESIEELHRTLAERQAQLEETHAGLPTEALVSPLVTSVLGALPEEDELESLTQLVAVDEDPVRLPDSSRRTVRHVPRAAWRRAVVLSEVFAPPIALRPPAETAGRLPG
ncbi:MAG: hypothetical protein KDC14_08380 [Planctomycetes bacterium]|nr:hypothetical protein [Planctomycetota bacterium]